MQEVIFVQVILKDKWFFEDFFPFELVEDDLDRIFNVFFCLTCFDLQLQANNLTAYNPDFSSETLNFDGLLPMTILDCIFRDHFEA